MKTKTNQTSDNSKSETKTLSKGDLKSAAIQVNKLLKGIDNDTSTVLKQLQHNNEKIKQMTGKIGEITEKIGSITKTINTISSAAIGNTTVTPTKESKPKEASKSKEPKPQKDTKKASEAKPATNKAKDAKKPEKTAKKPEEKPPLKMVIDSILSKSSEPVKTSVIYAEVSKVHDWARQSLYNALKDSDKYIKVGDGADSAYKLNNKQPVTDNDADKMIDKMESSSVANVV